MGSMPERKTGTLVTSPPRDTQGESARQPTTSDILVSQVSLTELGSQLRGPSGLGAGIQGQTHSCVTSLSCHHAMGWGEVRRADYVKPVELRKEDPGKRFVS